MKGLYALVNIRSKMGFSQKDMAQELGVSLSFYEKIERGQMKASRSFMEKTKAKYPEIMIDDVFFCNTDVPLVSEKGIMEDSHAT